MSQGGTFRPAEILLVEDNPGDARLILEVTRDSKSTSRIHHVTDGVDAMLFLRRQGKFAEAPVPDIVLLDLNLPRKDGREVLAEIKNDDNLQHIPVIALTSSSSDSDIERCYDLGVNAYLVKPTDFGKFVDVVNAVEKFWLHVVTLPGNH
jgi:chemotaxis family two-component system response regulator Rcp1